jgi:hypothetical protein
MLFSAMGRTVPTYVQQVREIEAKWAKFRRALRREDQVHFDRLLRSVRYYTPSATYQCSDDPMDSVMVSILLDLQKRLAAIEEKLKISDESEDNPVKQLSFPEVEEG